MTPMEEWLCNAFKQLPKELQPPEKLPDSEQRSTPLIVPQKMVGYLPVSYEMLMDVGAIPDTRPPGKPPTRRERFRWWRSTLRERFSIWLYQRVSGEEFPSQEDY